MFHRETNQDAHTCRFEGAKDEMDMLTSVTLVFETEMRIKMRDWDAILGAVAVSSSR